MPESATEPWTIRKVVEWATEDFRSRGMDTPKLEAELLVCQAIGVDRIRILVDGQRPLDAEELAAVRALIKRRRTGEPVAYIRGFRDFYGRPFRVDRRVLIPRPDTEVLVEVALHRTRHWYLWGRCLDLCTGSGAVAISFALERRTWSVTATDLSDDALAVAMDNALRLGALNLRDFAQGDLFAALPRGAQFELVTANPPYIATDQCAELPRDLRDFEPLLAFDGGFDGLEPLRRILQQAPPHLVQGGVFAAEIGSEQGDPALELLRNAGFEEVELRRDYGNRARVVSGILNHPPDRDVSGGARPR